MTTLKVSPPSLFRLLHRLSLPHTKAPSTLLYFSWPYLPWRLPSNQNLLSSLSTSFLASMDPINSIKPPEDSQPAPRGPGTLNAFRYLVVPCIVVHLYWTFAPTGPFPINLSIKRNRQRALQTAFFKCIPSTVDREICAKLLTWPIDWESWRDYPDMDQGRSSEDCLR